MKGLIHIYCGDGKGKTTAAVGLAVRAAGAGKKVLFTQFFKNGSSSEIGMLKTIGNITTMHCPTSHGLFFRMNDREKAQAKLDYTQLLSDVLKEAASSDLLILDEAISACNHGMIPETRLADFLENKPDGLEVVLTGRNPSNHLLSIADYVTEMHKVKHPYDRGIGARRGIEF